MADRPPVPRYLRWINLLALLLFLAGAAVYGRAWLGLRSLQRGYEPEPGAALFSGMARFNHFWELSRLGIWLVWAAVGVAVAAALAALVVRRGRGD